MSSMSPRNRLPALFCLSKMYKSIIKLLVVVKGSKMPFIIRLGSQIVPGRRDDDDDDGNEDYDDDADDDDEDDDNEE